MRQVKRLLPYVRRYVQMAVYDMLDAEGAEYRKEESGAVVARLSVYGNVSTFSLSTEIQDVGTGLTVSMREPCPGLSAQGEERAVTAVADKVAQYLENELMINRRCFVPGPALCRIGNSGAGTGGNRPDPCGSGSGQGCADCCTNSGRA